MSDVSYNTTETIYLIRELIDIDWILSFEKCQVNVLYKCISFTNKINGC